MRRPREEAERADGIARIGNKMQERLEVTASRSAGTSSIFSNEESKVREGGNPRGGLKSVRRGGGRGGEMVVRVDACERPPPRGWHKRAERARERKSARERERKNRTVGVGDRGGGGRRGRFFPIKQPAEFVFSPKRRCRFKVIDCHPGGGGGGGHGFRGGDALRNGLGICGGGGIGTSGVCCRSFRSVSFRLVPVSLRYVTFARPCISSRNIGAE